MNANDYFFRLKRGILRFIRKILGTQQIIDKIDGLIKQRTDIIERTGILTKKIDTLLQNQNFDAAYSLYDSLYGADKKSAGFNKDNFDALFLLATYFFESTNRYAKLTAGRGIFNDQWREGKHLNIKGVKLTGTIPDRQHEGIPIFNLVFQRSLLIHAFFDDNYEKNIVETLDRRLGEGAKGYKDGNFDVTVQPGDVVIDAGAWIGDFSAYAAYKGAVVHAFEPASSTYQLLCETAVLNKDKIFPVRTALSNRNGEARFFSVDHAGGNRITTTHKDDDPRVEIVPSITLDTFVEKNNIPKVDFIKADIQGGERDMLMGASNVLRTFAPRLAIATDHLPDDPIVLEEIIMKANPNYTIVQLRTMLYAAVVE